MLTRTFVLLRIGVGTLPLRYSKKILWNIGSTGLLLVIVIKYANIVFALIYAYYYVVGNSDIGVTLSTKPSFLTLNASLYASSHPSGTYILHVFGTA